MKRLALIPLEHTVVIDLVVLKPPLGALSTDDDSCELTFMDLVGCHQRLGPAIYQHLSKAVIVGKQSVVLKYKVKNGQHIT